jgi:hypothetical protein
VWGAGASAQEKSKEELDCGRDMSREGGAGELPLSLAPPLFFSKQVFSPGTRLVFQQCKTVPNSDSSLSKT